MWGVLREYRRRIRQGWAPMQLTPLMSFVWSRGRPGTLRVLGLLSGIVLLLALAASSSHSHVGQLGGSNHCPVCQVAGLHLDAVGDLPVVPSPVVGLEEKVPLVPEPALPAPSLAPALPRGPPAIA
jgi:hypothetical protein